MLSKPSSRIPTPKDITKILRVTYRSIGTSPVIPVRPIITACSRRRCPHPFLPASFPESRLVAPASRCRSRTSSVVRFWLGSPAPCPLVLHAPHLPYAQDRSLLRRAPRRHGRPARPQPRRQLPRQRHLNGRTAKPLAASNPCS